MLTIGIKGGHESKPRQNISSGFCALRCAVGMEMAGIIHIYSWREYEFGRAEAATMTHKQKIKRPFSSRGQKLMFTLKISKKYTNENNCSTVRICDDGITAYVLLMANRYFPFQN